MNTMLVIAATPIGSIIIRLPRGRSVRVNVSTTCRRAPDAPRRTSSIAIADGASRSDSSTSTHTCRCYSHRPVQDARARRQARLARTAQSCGTRGQHAKRAKPRLHGAMHRNGAGATRVRHVERVRDGIERTAVLENDAERPKIGNHNEKIQIKKIE